LDTGTYGDCCHSCCCPTNILLTLEIARNIGKSLTEFKKGVHEAQETKDEIVRDVRKVGDKMVEEAKDAAGLDELDEND